MTRGIPTRRRAGWRSRAETPGGGCSCWPRSPTWRLGLVPPGWSQTVDTRRRQVVATEAQDGVRMVGTWDDREGQWR